MVYMLSTEVRRRRLKEAKGSCVNCDKPVAAWIQRRGRLTRNKNITCGIACGRALKSKIITAFGETKRLCEWARDTRCGVTHSTLLNRIIAGWEMEIALSSSTKQRKLQRADTFWTKRLMETKLCAYQKCRKIMPVWRTYKSKQVINYYYRRSGSACSLKCAAQLIAAKKRRYHFQVGKRYHKLTLVSLTTSNRWNQSWWVCQCECGNITAYPATKVVTGERKSCGCLHFTRHADRLWLNLPHPRAKLITAFNENKSISQWLDDPRCRLSSLSGLYERLQQGWKPEDAITTPSKRRKAKPETFIKDQVLKAISEGSFIIQQKKPYPA